MANHADPNFSIYQVANVDAVSNASSTFFFAPFHETPWKIRKKHVKFRQNKYPGRVVLGNIIKILLFFACKFVLPCKNILIKFCAM